MARTTHDGLRVERQDVKGGATYHVVTSEKILGGIVGEYVEPWDEKNARARLLRQARALVNVWGTLKADVDAEEFCPDCERENHASGFRQHYSNCPAKR